MVVQPERRRFTVAEYQRMAEVGILSEDDRVELLDGEIVQMAAIGPGHAACVKRLAWIFGERFRDVALLSVQDPIHLNEYAEPEPDVALLRPQPDFYASGHPRAADVFLVVEVSDTTVDYDRRRKIPLYARHAIREGWQVDVNLGVVRVFRGPSPSGYRASRLARRGDTVRPVAFPDRPVAVVEILGPA